MTSKLPILAIAVAISIGCAPVVDGAIEGSIAHQRAIDREDSDRLAAQLGHLPGVVTASVVLHRAWRDPLSRTAPQPAAFTAVIAVDDRAAPEAIRAAAVRLARATLPELAAADLAIEITAPLRRPVLAKVGPFSVEESSRAPLKAVLALAGLTIAGLAAALAQMGRRHRLGNRAQ